MRLLKQLKITKTKKKYQSAHTAVGCFKYYLSYSTIFGWKLHKHMVTDDKQYANFQKETGDEPSLIFKCIRKQCIQNPV